LLAKWRWRLLSNDNSLWQQVIIGKYGGLVIGRVELGEESKPWFASSWCRDIGPLILILIEIGLLKEWSRNWGMELTHDFGRMFGLGKSHFDSGFLGCFQFQFNKMAW
jgi:hypothetical protein